MFCLKINKFNINTNYNIFRDINRLVIVLQSGSLPSISSCNN